MFNYMRVYYFDMTNKTELIGRECKLTLAEIVTTLKGGKDKNDK